MARTSGAAFVCLAIVGMDIVAGILGIEAENTENKEIHKRQGSFECKEASGDAFMLGLAATALLATAHVAANLLAGFMCICCAEELERFSNNRQLWFTCLILSWVVAAIGFPMLITGTLEISKSRGSCTILHDHFLSIGGILCFLHALFCIAFCVSSTIRFGNESTTTNGYEPHP